jgi:NAD(P)-dependent dehydrogenase (short-subunit alcohol dehydrogenase family)
MPNRVIAITGAFGILGRAVVEAALAAGHQVAAIDHAPQASPALPEAVLPLGGVDLTDPAKAQAAIDSAAAHFGRLDALLNIAGGFTWQTTQDGDPDTWTRLHRLNVLTTLHASRAALPHLLASDAGRIVNVGANAALKAAAGMGAYAASKAAVHKFTEALAEELKPTPVTVNAVLPSVLDTPANRADMPDTDPAIWVKPADLAAVMLFLAGPAAAAITGALIPVTGRV